MIAKMLMPHVVVEYLRNMYGIVTTVATLAKKRSIGGGSRYCKTLSGRILYSTLDLDDFSSTYIGSTRSSTSETDPSKPTDEES